MNLALELFISALGMIYLIVVVAEVSWKAQKTLSERKK